MDKLKKVLSGQDTEDRGGLSEVSASWRPTLLVALSLCPAAAAPFLQRWKFRRGPRRAPKPPPAPPALVAGWREKHAGLLGFLGKQLWLCLFSPPQDQDLRVPFTSHPKCQGPGTLHRAVGTCLLCPSPFQPSASPPPTEGGPRWSKT